MRTLTFTLTFLLFISLSFFAQETAGLIPTFDKKQKKIKDNLASYDTIVKTILDQSSEGAELIGYYKNNELALMTISCFGETGKRVTEYYYMNEMLYLVEDTYFKYNRPIYWDGKKAREQGDTATFDPTKTEINEHDKFYFRGRDLIQWLSHGVPVDKKLGAYKGGEMMIPKKAEELKRKLN
jgi:hypothetical protein